MSPAALRLALGAVGLAGIAAASTAQAQPGLVPLFVEGDAIAAPLAAMPGDAARGREIVMNRQLGLCLLCHSAPFGDPHAQGTLAPSLAGAGSRWSAGQLRLRIADPKRIDPATMMPSYYRVDDRLTRVGAAWQGRPLLGAEQIEDVVAFLRTLRDRE